MKIRFQADADLNPAIGLGLLNKYPGIDWRPARGFIADGTPDPLVLEIAALTGRVLVTADVTSMPSHFAHFVAAHSSPGVILVPSNVTVGVVIERLLDRW